LRELIGRNWTNLGTPLAVDLAACAERGKLVGARDSELGLGLKNLRRRDTQVIVILERRPDQLLELLVLEDFPPLLVAEGRSIRVSI
jgi:hypothetical protein